VVLKMGLNGWTGVRLYGKSVSPPVRESEVQREAVEGAARAYRRPIFDAAGMRPA